jgi:adenylate kinase
MSYRSKDLVIAVMGVTGVGKSTFISYFSQTAQIGIGLESCKLEAL